MRRALAAGCNGLNLPGKIYRIGCHRKTVRQEHANADGKAFVYVANKTDAKL